MRRRELLDRIREAAEARDLDLDQVREGKKHTIFRVRSVQFSVPRHTEINHITAEGIFKDLQVVLGERWWR